VRGFHASATNNAAAYGYSVTITATFGVLSTTRGTPGVMQILAFVAGAVLAFAVVEAVASGGYRHEMEEEPSSIRALGSSISVFSVGGALGLVFALTWLVGGVAVWPLRSFLATVSYLLAFALEITIADVIQRRVRREAPEQ
jgi:hypothetical protein